MVKIPTFTRHIIENTLAEESSDTQKRVVDGIGLDLTPRTLLLRWRTMCRYQQCVWVDTFAVQRGQG